MQTEGTRFNANLARTASKPYRSMSLAPGPVQRATSNAHRRTSKRRLYKDYIYRSWAVLARAQRNRAQKREFLTRLSARLLKKRRACVVLRSKIVKNSQISIVHK